jgi:hypothetical protein
VTSGAGGCVDHQGIELQVDRLGGTEREAKAAAVTQIEVDDRDLCHFGESHGEVA